MKQLRGCILIEHIWYIWKEFLKNPRLFSSSWQYNYWFTSFFVEEILSCQDFFQNPIKNGGLWLTLRSLCFLAWIIRCVCVFFGWQWVGKPYKTLGCGMLRSEKAWFFGLNEILSQYVFKKSWECSTSFLFLVANKKSIYQDSWICVTRLETVSIRILTWVSDRPCRPGRGANVVGGPKEAYNGGSFNWKMIFNWKMGFLVLEFS